jgi:hypothetical protein
MDIKTDPTELINKYTRKIRMLELYIAELKNILTPPTPPDIAEKKYDLTDFMNTQYPTLKRIPLSEISREYKKRFNIKINQADLKTAIEETKLFTVSNCSHKLIAIRI